MSEREDAQKIVGIVCDTVKSFGHLGFAMGKETEDAIAAYLSRRPVTEAAPGGLREAEAHRDEYQRLWHREAKAVKTTRAATLLEVIHLMAPDGEAASDHEREILDTISEWRDKSLSSEPPTPAPNREAELKVIEAAKKSWARREEYEAGKIRFGAVMAARDELDTAIVELASLAQSEMEGSKP